MNGFGTDPLPRRLRALYGVGLTEAVRAGKIEWRFTGSDHLELRDRTTGYRLTVTASAGSAGNPASRGKLRTLLRRVGGGGT